jgi:hypothetical protein
MTRVLALILDISPYNALPIVQGSHITPEGTMSTPILYRGGKETALNCLPTEAQLLNDQNKI